MLFVLLNSYTTSPPKIYPAPLGLKSHPLIQSGSDHIRSHIAPSCGTSCFLSIALTWSRVLMEGLSPPCTQKTVSSMMAVRERQSKMSVQQRQTLREPYFLRHQSQKPQTCVIWRDQWLPLIRVILSGYRTLKASSKRNVSTLLKPRSTKSPKNKQFVCGQSPPTLNSSSKSQNCP